MNNVSAFCKGPSAHLTAQYGEKSKILLPLIWISITSFVLSIIILITVPCAINLLNIGALIASFMAINGNIQVFLSPWYYFCLAVDAVFLIITAVRSNYCTGGASNNIAAVVEGILWATLLIGHLFYLRRLQTSN
jgi:hypothetical protein